MLRSGGSEVTVTGSRDGGRHPGDHGRVARVRELDASHSLSGGADGVEGVDCGVGGGDAGVIAVDGVVLVLHEATRVIEGEEGVFDGYGHDVDVQQTRQLIRPKSINQRYSLATAGEETMSDPYLHDTGITAPPPLLGLNHPHNQRRDQRNCVCRKSPPQAQ